MLRIIFCLSFYTQLAFSANIRREDARSTLSAADVNPNRPWEQWDHCSKGTYVQGISVKFSPEGNGALQGIRLHCRGREVITSGQIPNGNFSDPKFCDDGLAVGLQLKYSQKSNKFANVGPTVVPVGPVKLLLLCYSGSAKLDSISNSIRGLNDKGVWDSPKVCAEDQSICGIRTQFTVDKLSLSNLVVKCCNLPWAGQEKDPKLITPREVKGRVLKSTYSPNCKDKNLFFSNYLHYDLFDSPFWYDWQFCPRQSYVVGAQLSYTKRGLRLFCMDKDQPSERIALEKDSLLSEDYSPEMICKGVVIGVQVQNHKLEGIQTLRIFCSFTYNISEVPYLQTDFPIISKVKDHEEGIWEKPMLCGRNQAICGYKLYKSGKGKYPKALSQIKVKCCDVPDISEICIPRDKLDLLVECDATEAHAETTCTYTKSVGVSTTSSQSKTDQINRQIEESLSLERVILEGVTEGSSSAVTNGSTLTESRSNTSTETEGNSSGTSLLDIKTNSSGLSQGTSDMSSSGQSKSLSDTNSNSITTGLTDTRNNESSIGGLHGNTFSSTSENTYTFSESSSRGASSGSSQRNSEGATSRVSSGVLQAKTIGSSQSSSKGQTDGSSQSQSRGSNYGRSNSDVKGVTSANTFGGSASLAVGAEVETGFNIGVASGSAKVSKSATLSANFEHSSGSSSSRTSETNESYNSQNNREINRSINSQQTSDQSQGSTAQETLDKTNEKSSHSTLDTNKQETRQDSTDRGVQLNTGSSRDQNSQNNFNYNNGLSVSSNKQNNSESSISNNFQQNNETTATINKNSNSEHSDSNQISQNKETNTQNTTTQAVEEGTTRNQQTTDEKNLQKNRQNTDSSGSNKRNSFTTGHDWTTSSSSTWSEETTLTVALTVPRGMRTRLFQVVGYCAHYRVRSTVFKRIDDAGPNKNIIDENHNEVEEHNFANSLQRHNNTKSIFFKLQLTDGHDDSLVVYH